MTSSVAALIIALVGLGALSFVLSIKNREVEHERDQQKAVTDFLVTSFRKADPEQDGRKVTVAEALDEAVKELDKSKIDLITQATILTAVGETYRGLGLVRKALPVFENALGNRQKALGPNHLDTIESMKNLAIAYGDAGQLQRSYRHVRTGV